jgi:AcrR family transcriptional regulator
MTRQRQERAGLDKFGVRRTALAESALAALAERGFANTGLREIAQHAELSHGVLHYYFDSKDDLVAEAVWTYKSECARRYDHIVASSVTGEELAARVAEAMSITLRDEASKHRLWYDLRNQSLFDTGFSETIVRIDELLEAMVWAILERYAELTGGTLAHEPKLAYSLVDGMFQHALIRYLRGDVDAVEQLRRDCFRLITASAPVNSSDR